MQTFEQNLAILSKLAAADDLPHALLFTGPDRISKKNAAAQLCAGSDPAHSHILAESPITIRQIRDLKHKFSLSGFGNLKKIAIIENADAMHQEAANAFLKLLEEPRGDALFILMAYARSSVLATIASRAVEVRFPLQPPRISESPYDKIIKIFENGFLYEKFREAKKFNLQNKLELSELLDAWLLKLRADYARGPTPHMLMKKIFFAKKNILKTNANPQIIIEELLLCAAP